MKKPHPTPTASTPHEPLTIRFVRQLPNEEVVYYARRCAQKSHFAGPLTIVLEAKPHSGSPMHEVRLEQDGRALITESDPEILLAIRNAFDRLAMEQMIASPMLLGTSAAETQKLWS